MQSLLKNKMNFILTPSLEHRVLAKIATILWSRDDVKDFINKSFSCSEVVWREIVKEVVKKSRKLALPEILEKSLFDFIGVAGLQIRAWVELHHIRYRLVTVLPALFIWTSLGTIDAKRTAEILIKDESLGAHERFKLACMYCLEDDIRNLWNVFGLHKSGYTKDSNSNSQLVLFWAHYLEDTLDQYISSNSHTPYQWTFITAALYGNISATQYFMLKLNPKERDIIPQTVQSLVSRMEDFSLTEDRLQLVFIYMQQTDILLFLLSSLDAEQQAKIFEMGTYGVLMCLLSWPWQSLFLETARINWHFLSKQNYGFFLHYIVDSIHYDLNCSRKLLGEFWQLSPEAYKQYFTEEGPVRLIYNGILGYKKEINLKDFRRLLLKLCRKKDEKNIMLMLNDSSISAKKRFIFGREGRSICRHLISRKRFDSAKYLIQQCISTRKEMVNFRDLIRNRKSHFSSETKYRNKRLSNLRNPYVWDKYLKLIADCMIGYEKIKVVQDNTSSKAHFCKDIEE